MNRKKSLITEENSSAELAASSPKAKVAKLDEIENVCHQDVEESNKSTNNCNGNETHSKSESVTTIFAGAKPELNSKIFCEKQEQQLCSNFMLKSDYGVNDVMLNFSPFCHCELKNFISNTEFVKTLESFLLGLQLRNKNNDLYKFSLSVDLISDESPVISDFRRILCEEVKSFISKVTQIKLNAKVDLFCSKYKYTDVLLCHDDELEKRRIAFIYYLVPENWSAADGGTLDLFDTDDNGQPSCVVKSVVPTRNSFLFFEVSTKSFHQVAEVLSQDKTRLSISGWFHGTPVTRPPVYVEPLPPALPYGSIDEDIFYSWLNPIYLDIEVQADIRTKFEAESEIELTDFLQEEKYESLMSAIQDANIEWSLLGPANKRKYYLADKEKLPSVVAEFLTFCHSDAAFLLLSNLTGLKLHPLAPVSDDEDDTNAAGSSAGSSSSGAASNPKCRSEVRRWEHGCYTLAHDTDVDNLDFALDLMLYVGCDKDWLFENGGYTSYIAKGEDEELLSVCPSRNSLALVYRDKHTMKFVKHMNHRVTQRSPSVFYEINAVYYE
ncbi:prolyl 3-hydroxylase OGFOD1-like [Physella acuta]|uniref:prolyl 3-hydroxylase OGFOD1-like n=1 Tax=Physella acuta TaxID=109671 RepID=UPI0027DD55ED|nr:prolyl 3-hydroxylase OGFOD1-like [Physella acuta]